MTRVAAFILIGIAVLAATLFLARDLLPPERARFAAGPEGGGYWRFAEEYRDILARDDIELELVATRGSVENAGLLAAGAVDAGLLQGGVMPEDGVQLEALTSVFVEPLLVFAGPEASVPPNPARWDGLAIAAGPEGSGARAAATVLLEAVGAAGENTLLPMGGADAASALMAGEAEAALFVAPLSAAYLAPLLEGEARLVPFDHPAALSRRMPHSILLDVPSGAFSLDPPLPPRDQAMVGLVARMVARPGLHPAAVDRLVEAARAVHGSGDLLTPEGRFPSMEATDLPPDSYARDLLADGPGPLASVAPYWVNAQISRIVILALPAIILLLPLFRTLPGLYRWRIRSRVFRHYGRLREIDMETGRTSDPQTLTLLETELDDIERTIAATSLPLPYRDYAYQARIHIDHIRRRIADARGGGQGQATGR